GELLSEPGAGLAGLGQDEDSARFAVDAMREEKFAIRLHRRRKTVGLEMGQKRVKVIAARGMHREIPRLVDYKQRIIVKEDPIVEIDGRFRLSGCNDLDFVSRGQLKARFKLSQSQVRSLVAYDDDGAFLDLALDLFARAAAVTILDEI